jgi:hypothetical protein
MDLRAIDGDHLGLGEAGLGAQRQHLAEQAGQRALVTLDEPRDRRVIRPLLDRDHPIGDVLHAGPLDPARRSLPSRIGVQQKRDHHRRLIGRPAPAVVAIAGVELAQIHRRHRVEHEPREMALRQPVPHVGRHQKRLLAITANEALPHWP